VHSRNWAAFDAVLGARVAGVPVVVHGEHGREIGDPHGVNRRRNRIRRVLSPLVRRFVAVSDDLRTWLIETVRVPARKVTTIRNGVDVERFGRHDRAAARRALGLDDHWVVTGTVGRLDPIKGQRGLIQAFATVAARCREARLVVAGDGPCRGELEGTVAALGLGDRVQLLGARRDVPVVLAALDVFVLPSIGEGMSNTVLEAMASGLPVVATRVGGNPELVEPGVNGCLVPAGDERALAEAIAMYGDDAHLRTLHGKASRDRAAGRFELGRMCSSYENLYAECLTRRGPEGR
jgi:sugar transferase (PEP-CTERM/EpsH1 system associated)